MPESSAYATRSWLWIAGLLVGGWLFYPLAPILTPFLLAGLLAYLGDPLVDKLEARRLPRTAATAVVFLLIFGIVIVVPLLLLPVIETQVWALIRSLPVLAGGQLFGFLGVLLALPVAAVLAVLVRHARRSYKAGRLYGVDVDAGPTPES